MQIIHCIIADAVRYVVAGAVGYGISLGVGHLVTSWAVEGLRKKYCLKRQECKSSKGCKKPWPIKRLPMYMGILDRFLYTTVWITGFNLFIAMWLGVKVARGWKVPEKDIQEVHGKPQGYEVPASSIARYNIFLIGNALCVIFGVLGGIFIQKILEYWPIWFN